MLTVLDEKQLLTKENEMPTPTYSSRLIEDFAKRGALGDSGFVVIDVGASGGLTDVWRQLGEQLSAHCFDPLTNEVNRLNSAETHPNVKYHAAWLTTDDPAVLAGISDNANSTLSFHLTSAGRAQEISSNYVQTVFNQGAELVYADRKTTLDAFVNEERLTSVDFVKIDTDGHDYAVLQGAKQLLTNRGVLGLMVECQLHGSTNAYANTFANIDSFLRSRGFALFQMDTLRYTRSGLPGVFSHDLDAQTEQGQVQWGDAVYFLDPMTRPELFEKLTAAQFAKLLILYSLFNLPDCAATLIKELQRRSIFIPGIDYRKTLDDLVPPNPYGLSTYEEYIRFFENDTKTFHASNWSAALAQSRAAAPEHTPAAKSDSKPRKSRYFRNLWLAIRGQTF